MRFDPRRAWLAAAFLFFIGARAAVSAHDVVVEQVVEMTLSPRGETLLVNLRLPAAVTGDPSLAALLKGADAAARESHMRVVAADIARNLELRQGDATLASPAATVRPGGDGASIDIELRYAIRPDDDDFSARLNAFTFRDMPVRTIARYRPEAGRERIVSIVGPATRVAFSPSVVDVASAFALRGLRALFESGDHLLFLVCLLLPVRLRRSAVELYAAGAVGQAVVMTLCVVAAPQTASWAAGAAMAAASAIVIAAMQNIAGARRRWMLALTVVFGGLNGWALGGVAEASAQFAGAHRLTAMLVFGSLVLLGELWLGALVWTFRGWLDERGVPDRLLTLLGSAIVAHSAIHRVMDRAPIVAQDGLWGGERAVEWLILIWLGVILLIAAANSASRVPEQSAAS